MDGGDHQPRRPSLAVRFSETMRDLDPGVRIGLRWLVYVLVLAAAWRKGLPDLLSWLP